jgi:NADH dehydrogenase [ubiquinone] 1 alpha subcomplex assembly factor 7
VRTSEYLVKTSPRFADLPTGSKLEISPSGFRVARKIAELLQVEGDSSPEAGGSALFIDYGDDRAFGDSIRVIFFPLHFTFYN